jgi:hypothetical protein
VEGHRDYRLVDLPGYTAWSRRKLAAGESEALIAHLDASCACLSPAELATLDEGLFEELLADLRVSLGKELS